MSELAEVRQLREAKGAHDLVIDGTTYMFRATTCGNHIHMAYVKMVKLKEALPPYLANIAMDTDQDVEMIVSGVKVRLNRWEKLFRISLAWKSRYMLKLLKRAVQKQVEIGRVAKSLQLG